MAEGIAVVGMACRFPGAPDVERFWANLRGGVDSITRFSRGELVAAGVDPATAAHPDYVPCRGVIDGGDRFDWSFFGYSPAEAAGIDPQQRVFLECAAAALDDAGVDPGRFDGWIGTFAGCDTTPPGWVGGDEDALATTIGGEKDFLATRVAYKLGLRGPAVTVQTACSTSLAAVHVGCQSLLGYESDVVLAGGATVWLPAAAGYRYREGDIMSRDGRCRPFDADASGTVSSDGVGMVVLRRLDDALQAGDRVVAVIRATAINNDGGTKIGYTAPSVAGQRDVIRLALAQAEVPAGRVGYVEAHGTGTPVGDPVELAALAAAFEDGGERSGPCWVGAVKGNIGHTGAAAGVAGLIKTALMLERRLLVPTAHFRRPNPELRLEETPFLVCAAAAEWASDGPRIAGVSSFGIGGTNVHAVLEEAPIREVGPERPGSRLICLSAASPAALDRAREAVAARLAAPDPPRLADAGWTLATGRRRFQHRLAVVGDDVQGAAAALRAVRAPAASAGDVRVGFLFPGQGTLSSGAGRAAYELLPELRRVVDQAAAVVDRRFGIDLAGLLRPGGDPAWTRDTQRQQLGLFVIGYGLAAQLRAWGVEPAAMLGHSVGEYVAAALAGVWTLEEALALVGRRGRAMQETVPGRMLAVSAPADAIADLLAADVRLGLAVDGPGQAVVAGPPGAVDELAAALRTRRVASRAVDADRAFHSPLMAPAADDLRAALLVTPARRPVLPFVSNLTGDWADPEAVRGEAYWTAHLRQPVRLSAGLGTLLRGPCTAFVELGPGETMTRALRRHSLWSDDRLAVALLGGSAEDERRRVLAALGALWERGVELELGGLFQDDRPLRCALPPHHLEPRPCPVLTRRLSPAALDAPVVLARRWVETEPADGPLEAVPLGRLAEVAPERLDEAADRTAAAGDRLLLAGRGLAGVLDGEPADPDAGVLRAWAEHRARGGAAVALLDLGAGQPPERPPARRDDAVLFAWRGERWWALAPVPVAAGGAAEPATGPVAVVTWGRPGGRGLALDLARRGLPAGAHADPEQVVRVLVAEVAAALPWEPAPAALSRRPDLVAGLDAWAAGLMGRFLLDGGHVRPGEEVAPAELRRRVDPHGRLPGLSHFLVRTLVAEGWLRAAGDRLRLADGPGDRVAAAQSAAARLDEVAGLRRLLQRCVGAYPAVFAGSREPVSVLYPDGDEEPLRADLEGNAVPIDDSEPCLDALAWAVRDVGERHGGALRVLEVGAGQGELTRRLVRCGVEVHVTDVSPLLVRRLGEQLRALGATGVETSVFDITREPDGQGLVPGTYDMVVAYNAVHVAPRPGDALAGLARLLAPGGWLGLVELTGARRWTHAVWGLAPGWWAAGEAGRSAVDLDAAGWERLLRDAGLVEVGRLPADGADHALLLARVPDGSELTPARRVAGALRRHVPGGPAGLLFLPGPEAVDARGWAELRGSPELADVARTWAISEDPDPRGGWRAALRRRALDPQPSSSPAAGHHLEVARLGAAELAALPGLLARRLPPVSRVERVPAPAVPGDAPERAVPAAAGTLAVSARAPVPEGDSLAAAVAGMWREVLGTDPGDGAGDFFQLGGDSLMVVHLQGLLRDRLGEQVPIAAFTAEPTFDNLVRLVSGGRAGAGRAARDLPDLTVLRAAGAGRPVFLAAPAAGSSLCYRHVAAALDRPCFGIDVRGLHGGTTPADRFEEIAAQHVEAIRRAQPRGPYVLGGWSVGAMVAHEMARQLGEDGERVEALVCLDGYVEDTGGRPLGTIPALLARGLWYRARPWLGRPVPGAGRTPGFAAVWAASLRAMIRYVPREAPCRVLLFKTGLDERLRDRLLRRLRPLYAEGVEVLPAPGTHWTVLEPEHAPALAEAVDAALAGVQEEVFA